MSLTIRRVLAPTDFSAGSRKALEYAINLAEQLGAALTVLHVGDHVEHDVTMLSPRRDIYHKVREEQQKIRQAKLQELIAELRAAHPQVAVEARVTSGAPHEVICNTADEIEANMIVMGTSGLTGLSHFLIGSTAERVVRVARVPVLTVRAS